MASILRNLLSRLDNTSGSGGAERANETVSGYTVTDWARMFRPGQQVVYNNRAHQGFQVFGGGSNAALYDTNSVVFAVESRRVNVFAEARFQYQRMEQGRPGDLFGTPALALLEEPWIGATTRDLLVVSELDVATAGNSYWVPDPQDSRHLLRLDPGCVKILTEAAVDPVSGHTTGERLLGYVHVRDGREPTYYAPDEIAHFKPIPHPGSQFIGASWLNACLPDIESDRMMTSHRSAQLRNRGELGYVVSLDAGVEPEAFQQFVAMFREEHEGPENSGKTLFLGGGADVKTVGQSFQDLALKAEQGATETRIAACGGVHPVVVGLSEALAGSSLNVGNYDSAKRSFGDITMRPAWGAFAGAFASLLPRVAGARLWYDDRDIPFLRQDVTAQAEVFKLDMESVNAGIAAGFDPDAVVQAVRAGDIGRLVGAHSGLVSVQLQPPGSDPTAGDSAGSRSVRLAATRQALALPRTALPSDPEGATA